MAEPERPPPTPTQLPTGEWLFKSADLVFGPIPGTELLEKIDRGELPPDILVAREGGEFHPIGEVTVFMTVAAKASARERVNEQLRAENKRLRRRRAIKLAALAAAASLGVGGAVAGVLWAIRAGVFERQYEELAQIEILGSPPLIVASTVHAGDDELEYLEDAEPLRPGVKAKAGAPRGGSRAPQAAGPTVESNYDQAAIQAVVQGNQNRLHACLKEQIAREPGFRGELPITFTVGNQGKVIKLWIERAGYASGPLFSCMEAQLGTWRFPIFKGERPSVSLSFRVGG